MNGTTEQLQFETMISDQEVTDTCVGHVNITRCSLNPAIGQYQITISDGKISLAEDHSYPKIVARANNTAITKESIASLGLRDPGGWADSTLAGIALGMNYHFGSAAGLVPSMTGNGAVDTYLGGLAWLAFQHQTNYKAMANGKGCAPSWTDPWDQIMAVANEIMFRTGVYAAHKSNDAYLRSHLDAGVEVYYNVTGDVLNTVTIFESNFTYFATAAVVELASILVILFTFHGWWRLGRHATFSPLETAKAFDAPLLASVASNHNGNRIARLEGERKIRYGVLNADRTKEKIVIADEAFVQELGTENSRWERLIRIWKAFDP